MNAVVSLFESMVTENAYLHAPICVLQLMNNAILMFLG